MATEEIDGQKPWAAPEIIFSEDTPAEVQAILRSALFYVEHNPVLAERDLSMYADAETAESFIMQPQAVAEQLPTAAIEQKRRHFRRWGGWRKLVRRNVEIPAA